MRGGVEPVADHLERGGVDADAARRVGREAAQDDRATGRATAGRLDLRHDVRRHELAAVGDHRVEARHLERRHRDVLLADRELDRVARVPGLVPVAREGPLAPGGRRHEARLLARRRRSPPARRSPNVRAHSCMRVRALVARRGRSGSRRRRSTCRTTSRAPRSSVIAWLTYGSQFTKTCLSRPYVADGVHGSRLVRLEQVLLHGRERDDRLPRRARRVDAVVTRLMPG